MKNYLGNVTKVATFHSVMTRWSLLMKTLESHNYSGYIRTKWHEDGWYLGSNAYWKIKMVVEIWVQVPTLVPNWSTVAVGSRKGTNCRQKPQVWIATCYLLEGAPHRVCWMIDWGGTTRQQWQTSLALFHRFYCSLYQTRTDYSRIPHDSDQTQSYY